MEELFGPVTTHVKLLVSMPGVHSVAIHFMAGELPNRFADEMKRLSATGAAHRVIGTLARELPRREALATGV
jgi:hypothetical protein